MPSFPIGGKTDSYKGQSRLLAGHIDVSVGGHIDVSYKKSFLKFLGLVHP